MPRYNSELFDDIDGVGFNVDATNVEQTVGGIVRHRVTHAEWVELIAELDAMAAAVDNVGRYRLRVVDATDNVTFIYDSEGTPPTFTQTANGAFAHQFTDDDWAELKGKIGLPLP